MRLRAIQPLSITLAALFMLLAWDATTGDLWLARRFGTPFGFPWRENAWLVSGLHTVGKDLCWLLVVGLLVAVRWPVGVLRRLSRAERWQMALSALLAVGVVAVLKHVSRTSCPWDLQAFGGSAAYVSHWRLGGRDGGPGGCFPAGHASAAFAFLGGWFALRRHAPRAAAIWLGAVLFVGLAFGIGQQMRGAHFMSHTLWTAWICWVVGWGVDGLTQTVVKRRHRPTREAEGVGIGRVAEPPV